MPVNLGAFAEGFEAGQTRQTRQENLKSQKQKFQQSMRLNQQKADINDLKMQDLQNKLDSQTRLNMDSQRSTMRTNVSNMFDSGNPVELDIVLESVNESPIMRGKKLRSATTEDTEKALKYIATKGYSSDNLYVIDKETGKARPPVKIGPDAMAEQQEADERVRADNVGIANALIEAGQLVVNSDGQLVGVEDIASITGHFDARPSDQIKNDQILAGIRAKLTEGGITRRPTGPEEKQRILRESLNAKGLIEGTPEYTEAYNEGLEDIRLAGVQGVGGVKEQKEEDAIVENTIAWTNYKDNKEDVDLQSALRRETESKVRKSDGFKKVTALVRDTKQVLKLAVDINKDLASMKPDALKKEAELMRGPIENLQTWGSKFFSFDEQGTVWDDETIERIKNTFPINTKLGMLIQQYVKSISGATVTDAERDFFMNTLTGGDMADPDILRSTLATFQEVVTMRQHSNIDDLGNMGAAYTAINEEKDIPSAIVAEPKAPKVKVGDTELTVLDTVDRANIAKVFRMEDGTFGVQMKDGTNVITKRNPYE